MDIKDTIISIMPELEPRWAEIRGIFQSRAFAAKTTLLASGDISKYQYFVVKGCLRLYMIKENGDEVTIQFFLENRPCTG